MQSIVFLLGNRDTAIVWTVEPCGPHSNHRPFDHRPLPRGRPGIAHRTSPPGGLRGRGEVVSPAPASSCISGGHGEICHGVQVAALALLSSLLAKCVQPNKRFQCFSVDLTARPDHLGDLETAPMGPLLLQASDQENPLRISRGQTRTHGPSFLGGSTETCPLRATCSAGAHHNGHLGRTNVDSNSPGHCAADRLCPQVKSSLSPAP